MPAVVHSRKMSLFAILSLADLALTCFLLGRPGGGAYEWNPVASWWLVRFGWAGLTGFKLSIILLIAALTLVVSRSRPHVAGRLLTFGCVALLAVVVYSGSLVRGVRAQSAQYEQIQSESRELDRDLTGRIEFSAQLERLRDELTAGRCSLAEAVEILAESKYVRNGDWLRVLGTRFPGHTLEERLGTYLMYCHFVNALEFASDETAQRACDLHAQFHSLFGRPAPNISGPWEYVLADPT